MNKEIHTILKRLHATHGVDFSGYCPSMIERRMQNRLGVTESADFQEYLDYVETHPEESGRLLNALTINVSRFFRDPLVFEVIAAIILPVIVANKKTRNDHSLSIWSAGCALGEEPYSIAILVHELMRKEDIRLNAGIFASDIDGNALAKAQQGTYTHGSINNVKHHVLERYFTVDGESYTLHPDVQALVSFSYYDLLDKKTYIPPESVFGNFDMALCRNVLIYFQPAYQDIIIGKLHRSLAPNGYLVLGEAEIPTMKYQRHFTRVNECCNIYQKVS